MQNSWKNKVQKVGDFLSEKSSCITTCQSEKEAFARSAYSRYYYSVLFLMKDKIEELKNVTQHKKITEKLETILKKYERKKRYDIFFPLLTNEIYKLKNFFEKIKNIRNDAEYEKNENISFEQGRVRLGNTKLEDSKNWYEESDKIIKKIIEYRDYLDG